jgi:type II secretion system protein H
MNTKGFSLIELVVVMTIIGILLSIVTLDFNSWQRRSQIERQTRELFSDLNQARLESLHRKQRHSIVMQPNSYIFRRYSSENENRLAGTVVQTRNVNFQITKLSGSSAADDITEFDIRGFTNDNDTFQINPINSGAPVDCVVIATGRTNMGKNENGLCVVK